MHSGVAHKVDRNVTGTRNNFLDENGRAVGIGWDDASSSQGAQANLPPMKTSTT